MDERMQFVARRLARTAKMKEIVERAKKLLRGIGLLVDLLGPG